jgi:hypothetical protein
MASNNNQETISVENGIPSVGSIVRISMIDLRLIKCLIDL